MTVAMRRLAMYLLLAKRLITSSIDENIHPPRRQQPELKPPHGVNQISCTGKGRKPNRLTLHSFGSATRGAKDCIFGASPCSPDHSRNQHQAFVARIASAASARSGDN